MQIVADLHIHSKYSRAASSKMNPLELSDFAKLKGINLIATGDITHPKYVEEMKKVFKKEDYERGIYEINGVQYLLCGEISNVYFDNNACKKIHQCIGFKTIDELEQFNEIIGKKTNLESDGRPTITMPADEIVEITKSISKNCLIFPAHIWTPWFSVYGSNSGYNSIKDCYKDMIKYIKCAETGLSSDPEMNWRIKELDSVNMISNSDSHSPDKIGREANIIEVEELTYENIVKALENIEQEGKNKIIKTIEFYPEEGKYHYDGHRNCNVSLSPKEAMKLNNICPVCRKQLTIGVLHRVEELADENRPLGYKKRNFIPFSKIVPLKQIISQYLDTKETSKKVEKLYFDLIKTFGSELNVLLNVNHEEIKNKFDQKLADFIISARIGNVELIPGYDGVYGIVKVRISKDFDSQKKIITNEHLSNNRYTSLNDYLN